jgi:dUTP pyrophosphatase
MDIKIRYIDTEYPKLKDLDKGDWIDVYAWEDVDLKKDDLKIIKLGFAMQLPEDYEAHLLPRSSTAKKFGIIMANSMGIIDNTYCGDDDIWGFSAYAIRDTHISKGDRIAQFKLVKRQVKELGTINFIEVESLGNKNRGGFGSTGHGTL